MTPEELGDTVARLRRQGKDDAFVEVKKCASTLSSDIWESVSAFGNTRGGLIILGLEESNEFRPVQNFALDRVLDQFTSGMEGGKKAEKLGNAPQYTLERMDFEGAQILAIPLQWQRLRRGLSLAM